MPTSDPVSRPVSRPELGWRPGSEPVSRRTTLVGLAGVTAWVVSGCTSGQPQPGSAPPAPSATPAASGPPAVEPDVRLAATVLGVEQAMLDRVVAAGRRHPRLRGRLAGARAAHRAHVRLLASAVPPGSEEPSARRRSPAVSRSPAAALTALARAEDRLARSDRRSALAADSGAFARVLGSMAAAASQLAFEVRAFEVAASEVAAADEERG